MTFPFYNPVTVQDPVDDSNPTTKIYVDNGLSGKAESGHVHDARYSQLGHTHTAAATVSGTFDIARIPTGTTGTTVALGDHNHDATYAPIDHDHAGEDITSGTVDILRLPTGTSGTTVALGNDARFTDARTPTAHTHNASDVNAGTLDIARIPTGTTSTTVPLGNDARFTDARTPTAHASSHASAGSDPITPAAIGASATGHAHAAGDVTSGTFAIARIPTGTTSSTVAIGNDSRLSDARTPTAHAASHATGGTDAITPAAIGASATGHVHSGADITSGTVPIARIPTGTTSTTVALGNDSRFTDARTPTAHAASHATGGTDAIAPADIGAATASHTHNASAVTAGTFDIARIPTGTSGTTVALGNDARLSDARTPTAHVHSGADITSGTVPIAQLPTGTTGTTVALGNHNHDAAYAALSHNHNASNINAGTLDIARIPTGTSSTTVPLGNDTRLSVKPYPPVALTDGTTVATDASLGTHFRWSGTTSRIMGAPSNPTDGQVITYELKATSGTPSPTWNSVFAFGSDVTATSAIASGKTDFVQFCYNASASKWACIGYIKGFTL